MTHLYPYKSLNPCLPRYAFNFCGSATFFWTVSHGDYKLGQFNFKYECLDKSYKRIDNISEIQEMKDAVDFCGPSFEAGLLNDWMYEFFEKTKTK